MDYIKQEDLNSSTCTERYIKSHYPKWHKYLIETYPDISWSEKLYWYYNNITERVLCPICGKETSFVNITHGYRQYCSKSCLNADVKTNNEKRHQTNISRYGVDNPMKLPEVKKRLKDSVVNKYGVTNVFQAESTKQKIREHNLELYGTEYPLQSEEYKKHYRQVMMDRYGVSWNSQTDEFKQAIKDSYDDIRKKAKETTKKSFLKTHPYILDYDDINYTCRCNHPNCNKCECKTYIIPKKIYHSRIQQNIETCTTLKPINEFAKNTTIENYIKAILDEYNINYTTNNRKVLQGKEIDIYIPDKKIAIECNGVYWHSSIYKDNKYHYNKYKSCSEHGIQLLTIWEDWIEHKPDIVKSILLSKLGLLRERIYARNCCIREVSPKDAIEFLNMNHIQGSCNSKIRYGLYYKDKLVSLMTFGKKRSAMMGKYKYEDVWELTRFCNTLNTSVVGAAGKLLKHFIKNINPTTIESFASHDISNGNLYNTLGFKKETETNGSYWYIDKCKIRYHRFTFCKSKLIKMGYDKDKSEFEIMDGLGYIRIYDSGQTKYTLYLT